MKLKALLIVASVIVLLQAYSLAREEGRGEARPNLPPRPAPG